MGWSYCTWWRTLNTHTQPRINQIKTNTDIIIVAKTFKHTPQLANKVNAVESGMKQINVLKKNTLLDQQNKKKFDLHGKKNWESSKG